MNSSARLSIPSLMELSMVENPRLGIGWLFIKSKDYVPYTDTEIHKVVASVSVPTFHIGK